MDSPLQRVLEADDDIRTSVHELAEVLSAQQGVSFSQAMQKLDSTFSPHIRYLIHEEP